jgi:hypothetical protein
MSDYAALGGGTQFPAKIVSGVLLNGFPEHRDVCQEMFRSILQ